ncbi:MAG: hypothetical protein JSU03_06935 [Bacteroidetes bacterium]|nr:hypothetical protein [Bacteroidota bacterium]MBS1756997.1 hypothetical protein [Bacteroidota bacterium]
MKYFSLIIFNLLLLSSSLLAQPPRTDTLHRDTTVFGFNQAMSQATHAPILRGNSEGARIYPVRQNFCFDLTIDIDMYFGGRISRQTTLFINTTDGYMGYTQPSAGGPITELMPEVESFRFSVVSFKLGNVFMYHNEKASRGEGIDHLVTTSNSETHELQVNNTIVGALFTKKGQVRRYCDGKASAVTYKVDGQQTEWSINGTNYPQTFKVEKYLGLFGIGIIRTNAGIFTIMELKSGTTDISIKRIERRNVCFDPTGFKMIESDFYAKSNARLQEEREKIDRDEANVSHMRSCQAERMAEIAYRRELLNREEEDVRKAQSGNLMQNNTAQRAMIEMSDPLISVHSSILSTKTSICSVQHGIDEHPENSGAGQARLACLNQSLSILMQAEADMQAAERTYSSNLAQAMAEKSRIYMNAARQAGQCN